MNGCIHAAVWADKTVAAKSDRSTVHQIGIVIDKAIRANVTVITIVGIKGRENGNTFPHFWNQFFKNIFPQRLFLWCSMVESEI